MSLFVAVYFVVYGGMNLYAMLRVRQGLQAGALGTTLLAIGFLGLVFAPMLYRQVDHQMPLGLARACAFAMWTGMALVFWFVMLSVLADAWNASCRLRQAWTRLHAPAAALSPPAPAAVVAPADVVPASEPPPKTTAKPRPPGYFTPQRQLWLALGLLPLLCVWGFVEAGQVRVRTVNVRAPRLAPGTPPLRLLQIADLHVGLTHRPAVMARVAALARTTNADVIVSTGDLVDAGGDYMDGWLKPVAEMQAPLGKFAILGNHEFYPGVNRSVELLRACGFRVLRGETVDLGTAWRVAGVDDPAGGHRGFAAQLDEDVALPAVRDTRFTILLKHQPRDSAVAKARADLQLSGHTHQGQILPFGLWVRLLYPHPHGRLLTLPGGMQFYVSPGTGTWGPPFRVFARPELTLFVITPPDA